MTMVVRDEADVLEANLAHHFAHGVDLALVTDHASEDSTADILARHAAEGRVRAFREEAETLDQAPWVTRMARVAAVEHDADWVLHSDADEFWFPVAGSLKSVLESIPKSFGSLAVPRRDFVPRPGDGPFHERMFIRERKSHNRLGDPLEPKVAHRAAPAVEIDHGNHAAVAPGLGPVVPLPIVEILHFPIRSYDQFERKVVRAGIGYEALESRPPEVGRDQLELLEIHRRGKLHEHYARAKLSEAEIESGLAQGRLIVDRRLQLSLSESTGADDRPAPSEVATLGLIRQSLAALDRADATADELRGARRELHDAREQLEETRESLSALRGSRLVRVTRPARKLYYRLRGGGA
jgi:Glycosyl transferase family 2